jgi:hypothetical protein
MGLFDSLFGKKEFKAIKGVQMGDAKGQLLAQDDNGQLFGFTEEIMDTKFLKLMLVSSKKFRSYNGGNVVFQSESNAYDFEIDLSEIQSIPEDGMMVTEFDIEWNDKMDEISEKKIEKIDIQIGKAKLVLQEIVSWPIQEQSEEEE